MPKKSGFARAKSELAPTLTALARSRSRIGEFDWHELVPDVEIELRKIIEDDETGLDTRYEIARIITSDFFHGRVPKVPEDTSQLSMFFDADAYLTLGGGQRIRMADAKADHVERWRRVETSNFQAQSGSFFFKMSYIDERLPVLRERECNLGEIEQAA